jgi:hypothetical protein
MFLRVVSDNGDCIRMLFVAYSKGMRSGAFNQPSANSITYAGDCDMIA